MSEIIDISVGLTEEHVEISVSEVGSFEINATPTVIEVNIVTGTAINPQAYDLSDFTNNSSNPFVQYSALAGFVPTSRLITINGVTQDLAADRSWTVLAATTWGSITGTLALQTDLQAALNAKEPTITAGTISQYWRGDKTWQTFPTIPTVTPSALTKTDDTNVTLTLGGSPSTALLQGVSLTLGWTGTLADSRIASAATWNAKQDAITLTTTGSSGSATLIGSTLNIPTYSLSGLGGVPSSRTLTINGTTYDLSADRSWTIATGITIGTTPITSGVVGQVLFQGAGNVVQESANLFWDNTNGSLAVSIPSLPLIYKFGVGGSAVIKDGSLVLQDASGNISAYSNDGTTQTGSLSMNQYVGVALTSSNTNPIKFLTNNIERFRIFGSTGNLSINTTTDAGYKLDVNGSARIQASTTANLSIAETGGFAGDVARINLTGNSGGWGASIRYNVGPGGANNRLDFYSNLTTKSFSLASVSGNVLINATTDAGYKLDVNGSIRATSAITTDAHAYLNQGVWCDIYRNRFGVEIFRVTLTSNNMLIGTTTDVASSLVTMESTTKGFLPPRMTTTEKNAIATPATGLVVYDTTLGALCTYNGTTWITGGTTATWGSITGTLALQTDLQSALDAKVPYTGATADVDLGEYELKAGQLELDQTPTGTAGVAVMRWNNQDGTADLGLKGGNVTLQIGQENVVRVVNKTGADLLEADYKVVRARTQSEGGSVGQRLAVKLAQANSKANHTGILGLVTEDINNNQEGFVTSYGFINKINTTGSIQGETWLDGDALWLSASVAGGITNIEPTEHPVQIGYVTYSHVNNGKIFVKFGEGVDELDELHDVYINPATLANGDTLIYDSATSLWKNGTGGGGGASIIKLTAQTLTAASWTLSGSYYIYTFSNVNITVNTRVDFTPDNASYNEVTTCGMLPQVDETAGSCTFYSLFPPQNDITGEITIIPTV